MLTNKLSRPKPLISPLLLVAALSLSGCVTIQNTNPCTVNGLLSLGSTCAGTLTHITTQLTMDETLDLLEARPERPDPNNPGKMLPAHPAGIFETAEDWDKDNVVLQEACRELGSRCSYATQAAIARRLEMTP